MGSDGVLLAEMAAFWAAFDSLPAEPAPQRGQLLRQWLLDHGARPADVHRDGPADAAAHAPIGGINPVRVPG